MINLIWAMDINHLIGQDNKIPWHYKEDLKYYKSITNNKRVIMGENTYYSLKSYYQNKALPYKTIYVASLNQLSFEDAILVPDIKIFLEKNQEELYVVGGKTIYNLALPYADRLYITLILKSFTGDTYFDKIDLSNFDLVSFKNSLELLFLVYERKKQL
ncbi:MAG: dihydrofolate reductase [Acholeplasmatales bacterium]|jgi:dihydrofolate reductase|nr:dihydrofolate reductase [Acholeplasmatales bacterium]